MDFDPISRTFTIDIDPPNNAFAGDITVTIVANEDNGGTLQSDLISFTISVLPFDLNYASTTVL